ncbi:YoaK family protein [Undibacterium sp.]|uniref:YoaK family protein n=1 Tax=Undibacterium sp. TaxID=1914977 RepID=UPI003751F7C8
MTLAICAELDTALTFAEPKLMPQHYLAKLTSPKRSPKANLHLGVTLCWIAGALNAGGFLAVGEYTSHMTGLLSSAADNLILGRSMPALAALFLVLSFVCGATTTAVIINYAKRNFARFIYAPVLLLEAILLLIFGMLGPNLLEHAMITVSFTAILLCFMMGLQNALITKISHAEIRTTHITGLVTDIGIELGKLLYWNYDSKHGEEMKVLANRQKLVLHLQLVTAFALGALMGAAGFKHLGFIASVPLALALVALALAPAIAD